MSRKLKWNKSLDNPDANVIHDVVRSYISPQNNIQQSIDNKENIESTNVFNNVVDSVVDSVSTIVSLDVVTDVITKPSSNINLDVDSTTITNISSDTPINVLTEVQSSVVTNVESNTSSDISINIAKDTSTNVIKDTSINEPTNVLSNTLINVSNEIPNQEKPDIELDIAEKPSITTRKKREKFKRDPLSNSVAAMAEWHTRAEQKVYEVMYKETIMHRQRTRFFSYKELSNKTGLRNNRTIIIAVTGLEEKKSIDILTSRRGEKLGREYSIYPPHEILSRRRELGMKIHSQTKKILT